MDKSIVGRLAIVRFDDGIGELCFLTGYGSKSASGERNLAYIRHDGNQRVENQAPPRCFEYVEPKKYWDGNLFTLTLDDVRPVAVSDKEMLDWLDSQGENFELKWDNCFVLNTQSGPHYMTAREAISKAMKSNCK